MNRRRSLRALLGMIPLPWLAEQRLAAVDPDDVGVRKALSIFVAAFENLDWPAFRRCFAPGVTMFHPSPPNTYRIDSPEQFDTAWKAVFSRIRQASGRDHPPFMTLDPKNLQITTLPSHVALATFHLVHDSEVDRRTILFKRSESEWKIVHIHASNLKLPDGV